MAEGRINRHFDHDMSWGLFPPPQKNRKLKYVVVKVELLRCKIKNFLIKTVLRIKE